MDDTGIAIKVNGDDRNIKIYVDDESETSGQLAFLMVTYFLDELAGLSNEQINDLFMEKQISIGLNSDINIEGDLQ